MAWADPASSGGLRSCGLAVCTDAVKFVPNPRFGPRWGYLHTATEPGGDRRRSRPRRARDGLLCPSDAREPGKQKAPDCVSAGQGPILAVGV